MYISLVTHLTYFMISALCCFYNRGVYSQKVWISILSNFLKTKMEYLSEDEH